MKRLLLAVVLLAAFALTRAGVRAEQDDALDSLVGMADASKSDKGPDAGDISADRTRKEESKPAAPEPLKTDEHHVETKPEASPEVKAPAPIKGKRAETRRDEEGPSVAVPASAAPRIWTKVFSSLLPAPSRATVFEVAASTSARRARLEPAHPATPASVAGSAQGMIELVAAATAPYGAEEPMRDAVAEKPVAPPSAER
jgi:hypothetical protein